GTLYAYYPHDGNVDISAIPVDMTAADQTDWLYATPVTDVNEDKASVAVTLNHALANINVSLVKGSYVGTGNVTAISVKSDGIAPKGTFNAAQATPDYTAFEDEGAALERTVTTTLGGSATDIMVVPTGSSATITFNVTVDGTVFTATSAAVELEKGSSYKYTLTLNSTFMGVSDVSVTPWNPVTKESLTLEKSNKGVGTIDLTTVANGVYAVAQNGKGVTIDDADETCIAVALITDNQRIMIEKNETANAEWNSNTTLYWGKNLYNKDVAGITEATDKTVAKADFSGKEHTNAIITAYTEHSVDMDAQDMCKVLQTFNDGENNGGFTDWYIPAAGQLYEIYTNKTNINAALTAMSSTAFSGNNFWSSSEYDSSGGWYVDFSFGYVYNNSKSYNTRVRFVRDI
ncbi:MAG: fimbrillin family protein, partial [Lachnospiraceae bacterium]|nr:fimbrillin family protein [Lachnospiraceae bacterium]